MTPLLAIAWKDLRMLVRVRMAAFFTLVWPIVTAVIFGIAFGGGSSSGTSAIRVAISDEDATAASRAFIDRLAASGHFDLARLPRDEAEAAVRRGQRTALIVIPRGFGERSAQPFAGSPRQVQVGADPSRRAEIGMIEGLLMREAAEDLQRMFTDADASSRMVDETLRDLRESRDAPPELVPFLEALKTFLGSSASRPAPGQAPRWVPLEVTTLPLSRERRGPANAFEVTFPQGVLWGLIGCVMSFGLGLVNERTRGTLVRLAVAPIGRARILGGKALACATAMIGVQGLLYALGYALFGVRPASWPLLALASLAATVAFCGIMMLVATLGDSEQAASGLAWAVLMPLAMVGGGMIPQFLMPPWMSSLGSVSPVKWAILAIEGAIWRGFSLAEMALPCAILVAVGVVCFVAGVRRLRL